MTINTSDTDRNEVIGECSTVLLKNTGKSMLNI